MISAAIQPEEPAVDLVAEGPDRGQRAQTLAREHFAFVWRVARRLGLAQADAEDAVQRVLLTAAKRLDDLLPGKERAFLFRVATFEASRARRSERRRREDYSCDLEAIHSTKADPEQLLDQRQALAQLDAILEQMTPQLREAFVLYEIEGLSQREMAVALGISEGTVASRMRRAREQFTRIAIRHGVVPSNNGGSR